MLTKKHICENKDGVPQCPTVGRINAGFPIADIDLQEILINDISVHLQKHWVTALQPFLLDWKEASPTGVLSSLVCVTMKAVGRTGRAEGTRWECWSWNHLVQGHPVAS